MDIISQIKSASENIKKATRKSRNTILYRELGRLVKIYLYDFLQAKTNPRLVQERILRRILWENRNTEYGKKYSFSKIKTIEEFQKSIPVVEYKNIKKYIDRIADGEQNILTKRKVIYFATTSGTTRSKFPKIIPITKLRQLNFRKEFMLWGLYVLPHNLNVLKGKTLYFAGPPIEGKTKAGIPFGSISGYHIMTIPWYLKRKLVVPWKVYNIFNFDEKTKKIALLALKSDISQIAFASPIEAILFFDYLKENKDKLISELRNKRLVKRLKSIKDFKPINIWPKLSLISCIVGNSNSLYLNTLKEKIGKKDISIRDPGIYASEGRLTLCIDNDSISGVPMVNTLFIEFLEEGKKEPVTMEKLKLNKLYKIIITSPEGLYRYDMGDIVKVTGFKNKLPLLKFHDRDNFLNIAGELAHENVMVSAMEKAIRKSKVKVKAFTFIPYFKDLSKKPRYEVLVEMREGVNDSKAKEFKNNIDLCLKENISDYKQMRNEFGRMDSPVLSLLKKGSYDAFNKKRVVSRGQPKPINIHKDFSFRDNFMIEKTFN